MFKPQYSVGDVYHNPVDHMLYEILAVSPTPEYGDPKVDRTCVWVYFAKLTDLLDDTITYTSIWDYDYPAAENWQLLPSYEESFMDTFKDDIYWVQ
jgi:hypothetical protein